MSGQTLRAEGDLAQADDQLQKALATDDGEYAMLLIASAQAHAAIAQALYLAKIAELLDRKLAKRARRKQWAEELLRRQEEAWASLNHGGRPGQT